MKKLSHLLGAIALGVTSATTAAPVSSTQSAVRTQNGVDAVLTQPSALKMDVSLPTR